MNQTNHYLPLREVVFRTLRKEILEGKLQPGERLMEIPLAEQIGVSRTPVREAIRMLEQEGLVMMVPRRGAFVAQMQEKGLIEVLEVRRVLEELTAELAAKRITHEQIEALEKVEITFEEELQKDNYNDMARADEDFHYLILAATDNQKLIQLLTNFREQMYRYRAAYLAHNTVYEGLRKEHREILEGLREHDAQKAVAAMKIHIDRQQEFMREMMRQEEK